MVRLVRGSRIYFGRNRGQAWKRSVVYPVRRYLDRRLNVRRNAAARVVQRFMRNNHALRSSRRWRTAGRRVPAFTFHSDWPGPYNHGMRRRLAPTQ